MDETRALLRHTVATVAYRGGKAVRDAPASFASFSGDGVGSHRGDDPRAHRRPLRLGADAGARAPKRGTTRRRSRGTARSNGFFAALQRFDDYLASDAPLAATPEQLFQGAIADSLTHVGQLAILRRLAGARMKSENYSKADIVAGRVGPRADARRSANSTESQRRRRRERDHTELSVPQFLCVIPFPPCPPFPPNRNRL